MVYDGMAWMVMEDPVDEIFFSRSEMKTLHKLKFRTYTHYEPPEYKTMSRVWRRRSGSLAGLLKLRAAG